MTVSFETAVEIRDPARIAFVEAGLHRVASVGDRSLLTSRANNACESTRYAEIRSRKDVTYDGGRPARTVRIFV